MKINVNAIVTFFFILALASCKKEETIVRQISLTDVGFSDCKATENGTATTGDEQVEYSYEEGSLLHFVHRNVIFNCCQSENNLTVEVSLSGDSIIVHEFEKEPALCNCICPYDMECTIGPLEEKQYWIIVKAGGIETCRFPVYFFEGLEGVKSL